LPEFCGLDNRHYRASSSLFQCKHTGRISQSVPAWTRRARPNYVRKNTVFLVWTAERLGACDQHYGTWIPRFPGHPATLLSYHHIPPHATQIRVIQVHSKVLVPQRVHARERTDWADNGGILLGRLTEERVLRYQSHFYLDYNLTKPRVPRYIRDCPDKPAAFQYLIFIGRCLTYYLDTLVKSTSYSVLIFQYTIYQSPEDSTHWSRRLIDRAVW
jgi:hypothetical protein